MWVELAFQVIETDFINFCLVFKGGIVIVQEVKKKVKQVPDGIKKKGYEEIDQDNKDLEIFGRSESSESNIDKNLSYNVDKTQC